jgi:hypothetical protein
MRARFILQVETESGQAGLHQLRAALKMLGRSYGVRCVDLREDAGELEQEQDKTS